MIHRGVDFPGKSNKFWDFFEKNSAKFAGTVGSSVGRRSEVERRRENERGLSIGDRVQLHSLLRSPELNGVCGKIVKPQDPSTGRVDVEIENNGAVIALTPGNLARLCDCADCCIQLHRPILRGAKCMSAAYCSKSCQSKAWKAGHKRECVDRGSAGKEEQTAKTNLTADQMIMMGKVRNKQMNRDDEKGKK